MTRLLCACVVVGTSRRPAAAFGKRRERRPIVDRRSREVKGTSAIRSARCPGRQFRRLRRTSDRTFKEGQKPGRGGPQEDHSESTGTERAGRSRRATKRVRPARFSPTAGTFSLPRRNVHAKAKGEQVVAACRKGGEAFSFTEMKGRLLGYEWAPESERHRRWSSRSRSVCGRGTKGAGRACDSRARRTSRSWIDRYKFKNRDVQGAILLSGRAHLLYRFSTFESKEIRDWLTGRQGPTNPRGPVVGRRDWTRIGPS